MKLLSEEVKIDSKSTSTSMSMIKMRVNQVCTATILHIENVRYAKYVHFRCKITKFTDLKNAFMLKKYKIPLVSLLTPSVNIMVSSKT